MEKGLKKFIITKAEKIMYYKMTPRTDEEFLKRKAALDKQYSEAEKNYLLTSDDKYKLLMEKIKNRYEYNVSKSEYQLSIAAIQELRVKYSKKMYKAFWEYIDEIIGCANADI